MKNISKKKALILIAIGMFVIAISQILTQLIGLPDLAKGLTIGIGIGLLLTALIFGDFKTAQ